MWIDRRLLDLFQIEQPIVLSPMAGAADAVLAIAVAQGGGLGSLPCGMLDVAQTRAQVETFRAGATGRPVNLNFFVHTMPARNNAREHAWREALAPFYRELGVDPAAATASASRMPFDEAMCALVEEIRPEVVSFHYGLPERALPARGLVNRVIREMGPISDLAPEFPYASAAVLPLHAKAQSQGSGEFSGMLAGQAAALGHEMPAQALTQHLAQTTQALLRQMAG